MPHMTVAELITLLQTFPQDLPVTGMNGVEMTAFVSERTVRLEDNSDENSYCFESQLEIDGKTYLGRYVDIMGDGD